MYKRQGVTINSIDENSVGGCLINLVLINQRNGPRYQRVLALCAFLTGVTLKGLILRKFCVQCLCVLCKFVYRTDFVVSE